jgi:HSP20 family protein
MPSPFSYGSDPYEEMRRVQNEMNRVLQRTSQRESGYPAMNVYVSQDGVAITAELPGVSEEDLEVSVHRDTVTVKGKRKLDLERVSSYHRRERGGTSFSRTLSLPFRVDPDNVEASYRYGVLRLSLHRPEEDRPKRISVRSN